MNKRPRLVTLIGYVFIAVGIIGFAYHVTEFQTVRPFPYEILGVLLIRLLAIVCGIFVLRGHNWSRWLLVLWILYHTLLSAFHSVSEFSIHGLLLGIVAYFLFRAPASRYFRGPQRHADGRRHGERE